MGTKELRENFNQVAEPRAACQDALLYYENAGVTQWQRLKFSGIDGSGQPFEIISNRLRPGSDVVMAARMTAQHWLEKNPAPEAPAPAAIEPKPGAQVETPAQPQGPKPKEG
jgi:hypothetical protein